MIPPGASGFWSRLASLEEETLFQGILERLDEGVYVTDTQRKVLYWSRGAERITGFAAAEVVGNHCWDNILQHVDGEGAQLCTGLCPLALCIGDGAAREVEAYLHHKEGHRVPVRIRVFPIRDEEGKVAAVAEVFSDNFTAAETAARIEELEKLAYIDSLTGLANRRYGEITLQRNLEELRRFGWPFGAILMDVDDLKRINDSAGHLTGDRVLQMVASTLAKMTRTTDLMGRWGGDEFLALIRNVDEERLRLVARKFCGVVAQSWLSAGGVSICPTLSAGIALAVPGDSPESLLKRADESLYRSKAERKKGAPA